MKKQITLLITVLLTVCMHSFAQTNVKGVIRDSKNLPIPGATVKVKETGKAAASDINGNYTISAAAGNTLVFSSVGYTTSEEKVGNRTAINVVLYDDSKQLSDVVVIGYGTRAVKDVTGAINSVKAEKFENENPVSVTDLIKGNVPGISVGMNTSARGGGAGDLLVRGKASLTGNTQPLIVLDGVIYNGVISDINPNDIERIDVLKDASALAVYGSVSAAGVVAITTKKGKVGATQINFNVNYGITQLEKNQKFYQGEDFLKWRSDAARATNINNPYYFYSDPRALPDGVTLAQFLNGSAADPVNLWLTRIGLVGNEITNYNAGKVTDWTKLVFRTGKRQDYTGSLSGKTDNISYYMSGNFTRNQNEIVGDQYTNYRFRVNLEGKASKFLTLGINAQYALRDEGGNAADWKQIINSSPYGDVYKTDGSGQLTRIDTDDNGLNQRNPLLAYTYNQTMAVQNTLFASMYAKVSLPFGINYQLTFSPDIESYRNFNIKPVANPDELVGGEASRTMENRYRYNIDNLLSWNRTFGIHNFDVTLLLNREKYQTWYTSTSNQNFSPSDALGYHSIGSGLLPVESSDDRVANKMGMLARLNYTLLGKYYLTGSFRRDGYSAFGLKNPYANYPSGAIGWIFSEEKFMKTPMFSWLNFGKLRVSYGVNGNLPSQGTVDPTVQLALVGTSKYPSVSNGTVTNNTGIYSSTLQNADLRWEHTTGTNIGLDFGVWHNRITGSIDLYSRNTTDMLVGRSLSAIQGYNSNYIDGLTSKDKSSVLTNLGQVNNRGFEISLNSTNYTSKNFNWSSAATFTVNRNKIVHLYGAVPVTDAAGNVTLVESDDKGNGWFINHDINTVWDYKILGVWQANETAEAAKYTGAGIKPGDFKLEDVNGDHLYTDADKQFLGSTTPQFQWSLRNDFNFLKHFDFSFLLVSNVGQLAQLNEAKNNPGSVGFLRQSSYVLPYWTADNPLNDYARLVSGSNGTSFNVWRKSSFVRINTVSIGYNFDKKLVQRIGIQNAKIFASANNPYVFTSYPFWDPQNTGSNAGPTPRIFSIGLNATF